MSVLKTLTLVLTAMILVPSGAHLFELPGKITLDRDSYFTVQGIYAGWALFAIPIVAAILANATLFVALRRREPRRAPWALVSALLVVASLVVFFIWIFPANQQTVNWTATPENWTTLRTNWEYGHAANAGLVFLAFVATCIASISKPADGGSGARS